MAQEAVSVRRRPDDDDECKADGIHYLDHLRQASKRASQNSVGGHRNSANRRRKPAAMEIPFNTGHALPLTFVRFLRPRTGRGARAEYPRNGCARAHCGGHGIDLDLDVSRPHPRPRQSGKLSIAVAFPMECPCPQSVHIRRHGASATNPQPRNVRALSADCPRAGIVRERVGDPAAVRAVGMANRSNPWAVVVPCHRVIGKGGELRGYFYGLDTKMKLLRHENPLRFAEQGELF